ncbi:hypothetical protein TGPRC2_244570A, partial [Toxoplasma gondii TgCatPRC2]
MARVRRIACRENLLFCKTVCCSVPHRRFGDFSRLPFPPVSIAANQERASKQAPVASPSSPSSSLSSPSAFHSCLPHSSFSSLSFLRVTSSSSSLTPAGFSSSSSSDRCRRAEDSCHCSPVLVPPRSLQVSRGSSASFSSARSTARSPLRSSSSLDSPPPVHTVDSASFSHASGGRSRETLEVEALLKVANDLSFSSFLASSFSSRGSSAAKRNLGETSLRASRAGSQSRRDALQSPLLSSAPLVSWGDVLFQAHGLLSQFSVHEIVALLQAMARFGPACLLNAPRSKRGRRDTRYSSLTQRLPSSSALSPSSSSPSSSPLLPSSSPSSS